MVLLKFIPPASLLFLVVMTVVESQPELNVHYTQHYICALKGSTVTMGCTYISKYFSNAKSVFWSKEEPTVATWIEPPDLSLDPEYRGRVEYITDSRQDCSLRLHNVREQDQRRYYAVLKTTFLPGLQGRDGVTLSIAELQVEMIPDRVVEGDAVTLTCKSTCLLTDTPTFTWYKNGDEKYPIYNLNQLHLPSVSQEDEGSYSCAVRGQSYRSPAVPLNVYYPPKSVSVSISPSGEIVEGSSVTLTCSSDSNPPVQSYTWNKGGCFIGTGNTYTISRIRSEDSGDYMCQALNKHGHQSSTVSLNVLYPPKRVSVSISPSGEMVEGSDVTLSCSSDSNPPVQSYTWYKVNESSPVGSGQSYSFTMSSNSSGWFYCAAQNKYGTRSAAAVPLTLNVSPSSGHTFTDMYLCIAVGVGLCVLGVFIAGLFCVRRKRQERNAAKKQDGGAQAEESMYTSLEPMTRSSNDVYSTLTTAHPRPPDNTYETLDPRTISSEYDTLTAVRKHP